MDKQYILRLFPEIRKIKNKSLRQGVIDAWCLAMERGKWNKIDKIPFTLLVKTKKTLVEHTRMVTQMALAVARERGDVNLDFVIAGGLVHDVGKLLEYEKKADRFVKSKYGKRVRHPISGYGLVLEVGLPMEIAHIVAVHSVEGEKVVRSKEAVIINHCDFIDFDIAKN
jgi:putative nucleotidyltransferase with HDIG domain